MITGGTRDPPRQIGAPGGLDGFHRTATARTFDDADDGQTEFIGHLLRHHGLFLDGGIGRAATYREIVTAHHYGTAVYHAAPDHTICCLQMREIAVVVVAGLASNGAHFVKTTCVEQRVYAFAHGKSSAIVLAFHLVGAAHLPGKRLAGTQFVEFGLPGHGVRWRLPGL